MTDSPKKRPRQIGIKSFTDDIQTFSEIESPMRKKKRTLESLNLNPTATQKPGETPPADMKKEFARYEVLFGEVMKNFEKK